MSSAWYTVRVSGGLGRTILEAFPDLHSEVQQGQTLLSGELADCSALYGIVARMEALGLELIDIRRLTGPPESPGGLEPAQPCPAPEPHSRSPR